jgi:hypothetical protein
MTPLEFLVKAFFVGRPVFVYSVGSAHSMVAEGQITSLRSEAF